MTATTMEIEVATQLATRLTVLNAGGGSGLYSGIGVFTLGSNVRVGPVEPVSRVQGVHNSVPDQCIFVCQYGGARPIWYHGAGASPTVGGERYSDIQLWIRSGVVSYAVGRRLSDACVEAIDAQVPSSSLGIYELRVLSEPNFVQQDDAGHREWTVNLEASRGF